MNTQQRRQFAAIANKSDRALARLAKRGNLAARDRIEDMRLAQDAEFDAAMD